MYQARWNWNYNRATSCCAQGGKAEQTSPSSSVRNREEWHTWQLKTAPQTWAWPVGRTAKVSTSVYLLTNPFSTHPWLGLSEWHETFFSQWLCNSHFFLIFSLICICAHSKSSAWCQAGGSARKMLNSFATPVFSHPAPNHKLFFSPPMVFIRVVTQFCTHKRKSQRWPYFYQ